MLFRVQAASKGSTGFGLRPGVGPLKVQTLSV